MSRSVVVSIGRNIGDDPMRDDDWKTFKAEVYDVVAEFSPVVFYGQGIGIYKDTAEDSYTVIAEVNNLSGWARLHDRLAKLAKQYGQDSIAITLGDTEFIG